jgi:predicted ribosome quality control (RQC) complex YloA/Tae2 family protein
MGKERFSAFDVCAEVSCLRRTLLGLWCSQIYDGEHKNALLFKFNKPAAADVSFSGEGGGAGGTADGESAKVHLLVQPGVKLLNTRYASSSSSSSSNCNNATTSNKDGPSNFVQKLRKHVKQKRLNDIRQLGMDRAVLLTFGANETETRLVVELYASGNAVLCDREFMVMTLLRSHVDKRKNVKILGRRRYPVERFRSFRMPTRETWEDALKGIYVEEERAVDLDEDEEDEETYEEKKKQREAERLANVRAPQTLRECLCRGFSFSPAQCEHVAAKAGVEKGALAPLTLLSEETKEKLYKCIEEEFAWFQDVTEGKVFPIPEVTCKSLTMELLASTPSPGEESAEENTNKKEQKIVEVFDDFSPHPMKQNENKKTVSIDEILGRNGEEEKANDAPNMQNVFNDVLDEYYAKLEMQQGIVQRNRAEAQALKKFDKLKKDQENRLKVLERDAEKEAQRAELISRNVEDVEKVLNAVNDALASGMAWDDLESMINEEKRRGNPVAKFISTLDLKNNQVTIKLTPKEDVEVDETTGEEVVVKKYKPIDIPLDLSLSAFANCNARFEVKKKHDTKLDKTAKHHDRVVSDAEKKALMKIETLREKALPGAKAARKPFWFEKFIWWVTSENCLVLHSTDNTQAEMLFSKYANKTEAGNDCFIFCDENGSPAITLVKPPPRYSANGENSPAPKVPSLSLAQAAQATVARSECWAKKRSASAWWARAKDVSKRRWDLPEDASLLPSGSFALVKGARKKFLPPAKSEMGFGLLFAVSGENISGHEKERVVKSESADATFYDEGRNDSLNGICEISSEEEPDDEKEEEEEEEEEDIEEKKAKEVVVNELAAQLKSKASVDGAEKGKLKQDESVEVGKKKRISAAQRKQMKKKGGRNGDDDNDDDVFDPLKAAAAEAGANTQNVSNEIEEEEEEEEEEEDNEEGEEKKTNDTSFASNPKKPKVRGKSAKAKRAAKKYAEQDDEDRELAMKLLKTKQKETKKDRKKTALAAPLKSETSLDAAGTKKKEIVLPEAPTPEMPNLKERGIKPLVYEPNDEDDDENNNSDDENDSSKVLNLAAVHAHRDEQTEIALRQLTGQPFEQDGVSFCLPVCAPFSVLTSYKFRIKLTPGTQKRGKTVKDCANVMLKAPFASNDEKSAVREALETKLEECARTLPAGGCKITLPPGAMKELQKAAKAAKAAAVAGKSNMKSGKSKFCLNAH